jgi:hypothetical protein
MSWLASLFDAILTGIAGLAAAVAVAAWCVQLYHISSREGASGFFVVGIGLLGGFVGFILGLGISRVVAARPNPGFWKAFGLSLVAVLVLGGIYAGVARLLADVAPTLNGHELNLLVEVRLPPGSPDPTNDPPDKTFLMLSAANAFSYTDRKSERGKFDLKNAKLVNGRWTILGSVYVFTGRGKRTISFFYASKDVGTGLPLDLPSSPGEKYKQWSDWTPSIMGGKPWPETEVSYRFKIEEIIPDPIVDPQVEADAQFNALTPEDPLYKWIGYLEYGMPADKEERIMKVVADHPADLAVLIRDTDAGKADKAWNAVQKLKTIDPAVIEAMRGAGEDIAEKIKRFNEMKESDAGYIDLASVIRDRFVVWHRAWWSLQQVAGTDGRPLLEEIVKLARVHPESGHMQEVVLDGEAHLQGLTQLKK